MSNALDNSVFYVSFNFNYDPAINGSELVTEPEDQTNFNALYEDQAGPIETIKTIKVPRKKAISKMDMQIQRVKVESFLKHYEIDITKPFPSRGKISSMFGEGRAFKDNSANGKHLIELYDAVKRRYDRAIKQSKKENGSIQKKNDYLF